MYTTLEQAHRGERERADASPVSPALRERFAAKQVMHLRKYEGLLPGTKAAAECTAIEEQPF